MTGGSSSLIACIFTSTCSDAALAPASPSGSAVAASAAITRSASTALTVHVSVPISPPLASTTGSCALTRSCPCSSSPGRKHDAVPSSVSFASCASCPISTKRMLPSAPEMPDLPYFSLRNARLSVLRRLEPRAVDRSSRGISKAHAPSAPSFCLFVAAASSASPGNCTTAHTLCTRRWRSCARVSAVALSAVTATRSFCSPSSSVSSSGDTLVLHLSPAMMVPPLVLMSGGSCASASSNTRPMPTCAEPTTSFLRPVGSATSEMVALSRSSVESSTFSTLPTAACSACRSAPSAELAGKWATSDGSYAPPARGILSMFDMCSEPSSSTRSRSGWRSRASGSEPLV